MNYDQRKQYKESMNLRSDSTRRSMKLTDFQVIKNKQTKRENQNKKMNMQTLQQTLKKFRTL